MALMELSPAGPRAPTVDRRPGHRDRGGGRAGTTPGPLAGGEPWSTTERGPQSLDDPGLVFRAYGARVARWAQRLLGPGSADLEDTVQDVFLVAFRRRGAFDPGRGELGAWLHGITVRVVQSRRRRLALRRWFWASQPEAWSAAPDCPEEGAMRLQLRGHLYALLERLPEKQRTALILHDLEGLDGERIAQLTGATVGNVWVRVHRARKALAAALAAHETANAALSADGQPDGGAASGGAGTTTETCSPERAKAGTR